MALLEAVLTVVWKAEVVRGSLFWLVHPSRNFSTHTTDRKHWQSTGECVSTELADFTQRQFYGGVEKFLHCHVVL